MKTESNETKDNIFPNDSSKLISSSSPHDKPQRVVSLLGAVTETIYRLGLSHCLVGRSHECDYPPAVLQKVPCISNPKFHIHEGLSSAEIDASVRELSMEGQPLYQLINEALVDLQPDLIIAQNHCRVCAVTPQDIDNQSSCRNVPRLILKPSKLKDCFSNVMEVANVMGVPDRGRMLCETMEERMNRIQTLLGMIHPETDSTRQKPRVALLEWIDPIMGCGYWLPELVRVAGGIPLHCPPPGGATPTISFETLLESKPDVVIFALCGFGLTRAASEIVQAWSSKSSPNSENKNNDIHPNLIERLAQHLPNGMDSLFVIDGNYLINRSGPRVVESAEALCEAIHPDLQGHFGHFGTELLTTFKDAISMSDKGLHTGSTKVRPPPLSPPEYVTKSSINPTLSSPNKTPTPPNNNGMIQEHKNEQDNGPRELVQLQLQYLAEHKYEEAFSLNSIANRGRWCSSGRFKAVLRNHADFQKLLLSQQTPIDDDEHGGTKSSISSMATILSTSNEGNGNGTVHVALPQSNTKLIFTTVLEKEVDENRNEKDEDYDSKVWRTEKVGIITE